MHLPINHRLAGLYRFLAAVVGLYVLLFGIVGAIRTAGTPLFHRGDVSALGLRTNLAFSILSIVVGAIVVIGAIVGRNVAHYLNVFGGLVFWASGLAMLTVLRTEFNFFNFQVATCIVAFLIGTVLVLAGLYGKSGSPELAQQEEIFRHSGRGPIAEKVTTPDHVLSAHPGVRHQKEDEE